MVVTDAHLIDSPNRQQAVPRGQILEEVHLARENERQERRGSRPRFSGGDRRPNRGPSRPPYKR